MLGEGRWIEGIMKEAVLVMDVSSDMGWVGGFGSIPAWPLFFWNRSSCSISCFTIGLFLSRLVCFILNL